MKRIIGAVFVGVLIVAVVAGAALAANQAPPLMQPDAAGLYTVITPQAISLSGITPTFGACQAGGIMVANDGQLFIEVKNTLGVAHAITVTAGTLNGLGLDDIYQTIPATTGDKMLGPFMPAAFNEISGTIKIDFSGVGSCTIAAFRLPRP